MSFPCPNCTSNDTRKLSMIYSEGTSHSRGDAFFIGTHEDAYIPMSSTQQTRKAQTAAPPAKQYANVLLPYLILGPCCLIAYFITVESFDLSGDTRFACLQLWLLVWVIVSTIIAMKSRKKAARYNDEVWQPLWKEWNAMFMCERCGTKFTPKGAKQETTNQQDMRYTVLKVEPGCSLEDLKSAYRREAALWHPDKLAHLAPELREHAKQQMTIINEAYQSLCEEL